MSGYALMLSERLRHWTSHRGAIGIGATIVFAAILTAWQFSETVPLPAHGKAERAAETTLSSGPPWIYAPRDDARFTITLYADLECPYCKAYLPVLKTWIDRQDRKSVV